MNHKRNFFLPDTDDDDLQSFPDQDIRESKILDKVCAMRSLKHADKENAE
jgi:hypothetical protein